MSANHLKHFLEDIVGINPKYRKFTSSLKGLVNYLEKNVKHPIPLHESFVLRQCKNDSRLEKYKPAIKRLQGVWGRGLPYPYVHHSMKPKAIEMNRLCFRGDGREPATIFTGGFYRRPQHKDKVPTYRDNKVVDNSYSVEKDPYRKPIEGTLKAGDLDPDSAVCISPDMHLSALFPLPDKPEKIVNSWVYLCFANKAYDTNGKQVLDALEGVQKLKEYESLPENQQKLMAKNITVDAAHKVRVADIFQNVYGKEYASDGIQPSSIYAAMKIERVWNKMDITTNLLGQTKLKGASYHEGGVYRIKEIVINQNAQYASMSVQLAVMGFLEKMEKDMNAGTTSPLPKSSSGYHKSTML